MRGGMSVDVVFGVFGGALGHFFGAGGAGVVESGEGVVCEIIGGCRGGKEDDVVAAEAFVEPVCGVQVADAVRDCAGERDAGSEGWGGGFEKGS